MNWSGMAVDVDKCFALTSVAVHWCWVTVHLYEQQMSTGVIAVTQACSKPVLQKNT